MRRAAAGDPAVAALLDDRYRRTLTRYARSLLGRSDADAEDVVQDVLVKAHRKLSDGEGPRELRPWLYRLTRNRAIDETRRARWGDASLDDPLQGARAEAQLAGGEDPAAAFGRREALRALVQDLADLPIAQRDALLTRIVDDASPQESAERLGVSVEAVQMLVVRGRENLKLVRALRGASGDVETQLRMLAPPMGLLPLFGAAKLFGLGGGKVVTAVVAAVAVVATATAGLVITRTERAGPGQAAPFQLSASRNGSLFGQKILRGQKVPAGNAVVAATFKIAAGPAGAANRVATIQCPAGMRYVNLLNYYVHRTTPAVAYRVPDYFWQGPPANGTMQVKFASTVLAKPATVRLRVVCRKPGVGGTLLPHPSLPKQGEGRGYVCTRALMYRHPYKRWTGNLPQHAYLAILSRAGHTVHVRDDSGVYGWVLASALCPGYTVASPRRSHA